MIEYLEGYKIDITMQEKLGKSPVDGCQGLRDHFLDIMTHYNLLCPYSFLNTYFTFLYLSNMRL